MVVVGKFTQAELEAAYRQMREEREEDYTRADLARQYLLSQLDLDPLYLVNSDSPSNIKISPYPKEYSFSALFLPEGETPHHDSEKDAPTHNDLVALLNAIPGTRRLPKEGFGTSVFEVETPQGRYKVRLESILD